MPLSDLIEVELPTGKQLLLVAPTMQATTVTQQILSHVRILVSYRASLPENEQICDYVLLNLAGHQSYDEQSVAGWVQHATRRAASLTVGC
ncbi:hypothetical protein UF37_13235, partial [Vibrio parahaemolyticus]|uniref:hypothetical protein n=1 Tax=Vibrio parahaemolyticus TaxID=670 RepID=UPI00062B22F2